MAQQGGTYKISHKKKAHVYSSPFDIVIRNNDHIASDDGEQADTEKYERRENGSPRLEEGTGIMARIHAFITGRSLLPGTNGIDEEGWVFVRNPKEEEEEDEEEEQQVREEKKNDDESQDYWRLSTGSSIGIGWGLRKLKILEWDINIEKRKTYHCKEHANECEVDDDRARDGKEGGWPMPGQWDGR